MSTAGEPARIGVVASDPLRLVGMEAILSELPGMTAVPLDLEKLASAGDLAVLMLEARATDAVPEIVAKLRRERPQLRIIVVGEGLDPLVIESVIGAGAKGYLAETASEAEIRMALEVVLDGSVWAPRKVLARLLESTGSTAASTPAAGDRIEDRMTARELEVLQLLKDGRSNRAIAEALGIDEATVKAHLGRMLRKTGAHNRVELTLRAIEERSGQ